MNNNWISVKDRLPERCGYYWGYSNQGNMQTVYFLKWKKIFKVWDESYADLIQDNTITHWMPLPEPPNSDNNTNTFSEVSGKVTVGM